MEVPAVSKILSPVPNVFLHNIQLVRQNAQPGSSYTPSRTVMFPLLGGRFGDNLSRFNKSRLAVFLELTRFLNPLRYVGYVSKPNLIANFFTN